MLKTKNRICANKLEVKGPLNSLSLFKKKAIRRNTTVNGIAFTYLLSMDSLVPNTLNRRLEGTHISSDSTLVTKLISDWYLTNHGASSTSNFTEVENNGGRYCVGFDSAYAPPLLALKKISKDYPALSFDLFFAAQNNGYSGFIVFKNGEVEDSEYVENKGHEGVVWKQLSMDPMHAPYGRFARDKRDGDYAVKRLVDGYSIGLVDLKTNVPVTVQGKPVPVRCEINGSTSLNSDRVFDFTDYE